jgi:hypothetical protein
MFKTITKTWNPFTGCRFTCSYCWARKLVEGRLHHLARYRDGFLPTFHPDRANPHFRSGDFVFVCDLGDIAFAPAMVRDWIMAVVRTYPDTKFLLQSKDPGVFANYFGGYRFDQANLYLGTTLETNRWHGYRFSSAPSPHNRYAELKEYSGHKFISIEPIIDLDVEVMVDWLREIQPDIVEVGADNYHNDLPEPSWEKVGALLEALQKFVPSVVEKDGLERLKRGRHGEEE